MTAVLPISAEPAAIPREDARPGRWRRMPTKAKAGAILLGKLNTWEFGTGGGLVRHDAAFDHARNPWRDNYFTGGSSTGAGAAVAAGTAMIAFGGDTGGLPELRTDAHWTQV